MSKSSWTDLDADIFTPEIFSITLHTDNIQYNPLKQVSKTKSYSRCNNDGCLGYPKIGDICSPYLGKNGPSIFDSISHKETGGDACGAGGRVPQYKYYCHTTKKSVCGRPLAGKCCSMGRGTGQCVTKECKKGTGWNITSNTDYHQGWIKCNYNYDYTGYNQANLHNGPISLSSWINDLYFQK